MWRSALWWSFLAFAAACRPARHDVGDRCLKLPAAVRDSLTAAPDGQSLYWLERTRDYDFDASLTLSSRLVRSDLRSHRQEVLAGDVFPPLRFIGGQLLVRHGVDTSTLTLFGSDGHTQALTPSYLNVRDFEVIDSHSIAFLADGDGARAVYVLDLNELRPYPLVDADALLSASGGHVFARVDDDVVVVDAKTRTSSKTPVIKKAVPLGDNLVYVDHGTIVVHSMTSNASRPAVTTARAWKLIYQGDSVLVRSPPKEDRSYAYLLEDDRVTELPTIVGGASILRVATLGRQRWALIGHNTMNYLGDLADTDAEVDVCLLPSSGDLSVPTRDVPARFVDQAPPLFDALAATSPAATMQIADADGEPITVSMHLKKEFAGQDTARIRKRTQELHDLVTRLLHDPEIRTEVIFADRRRGIHRWRRDRLRDRISVGMGDALLTDPTDYDVEIWDVDNEKRDGKISCAGALRNVAHRVLTSVDVKCSGNRSHLIHFDKLEPGEARTFSQTFDVSDDDEAPYIDILIDGKPSEPRNTSEESTAEAVFGVATDVYAATGLWLENREVGDDIVVNVKAEEDFLQRDRAAQEAAVKTAYEHYVRLRDILHAPSKAVRLHVEIALSDTTIDYDGSLFVRDD